MPDIEQYFLLLLFGCAGGLLAGMLGIGGGIIYVFVLRHYLQQYHLPDAELVKFILSNSIAATFFAGLAGSYKQIRTRNYYPREIAVTGAAGVFSALLFTWFIVRSDWYSQEKFMLLFLLLLFAMAVNMFLKRNSVIRASPGKAEQGAASLLSQKYHVFIMAGLLTGAISSLSGLGGGVILTPILSNVLGMDVRKAAAISLGIIPLHALAMGVYYGVANPYTGPDLPYSVGYILLLMLLPLLAGVIIFTPLGVRLGQRLPQRTIKLIFTVVIMVIFFRTLYAYLYEV